MKFKQLFTDDSAVSPVIGVILMVAITVILAAVIGTFVLNLGQGINQSAPQASFGFDYEEPNVTVTHQSGDSIDSDQLSLVVEGEDPEEWGGDESVSAGDSQTFNNSNSGYTFTGQTVRLVWESENGENTATLSQGTAPNN